MPSATEDFLKELQKIVTEHYKSNSTPFLLSDLGVILHKNDLWPLPEASEKSLRKVIEGADNPDLQIVRDKKSPAFIAITTEAAKEIVEKFIERRHQNISHVPDLEALPKSVVLAFCIKQETGKHIYLSKNSPFKFSLGIPEGGHPNDFVLVDDKYRRPGLKFTNANELKSLDQIDLQKRIAAWSLDNDISLEIFYMATRKKPSNALERLLAVQRPGMSGKLVIPADIALLLSRNE